MELKGKRINFLGDSITEGHGVEKEDDFFVSILKRECGLSAARNYGIGGTRIARQKGKSEEPRWDLDFMSRVVEMNRNADIIMVFGGTNDFGHGDMQLGTFEDRDPYTFYGALHILITSIMDKYPLAKIVFMTPLHRGNEDDPYGDHRRTFATGPLSDYVKAEKEVCEYYSVPVLDLFSTSGLQPRVESNNKTYFVDGLHPNEAGHRVIADRIKGFLSAL